VWSGAGYNLTLFQSGGAGARLGADGMSATGFPSAVASVPTEVLELAAPVVQRQRSLRVDSGGAGRWRGGLGQTSCGQRRRAPVGARRPDRGAARRARSAAARALRAR
jgi:N-methylhydantoinase B